MECNKTWIFFFGELFALKGNGVLLSVKVWIKPEGTMLMDTNLIRAIRDEKFG